MRRGWWRGFNNPPFSKGETYGLSRKCCEGGRVGKDNPRGAGVDDMKDKEELSGI